MSVLFSPLTLRGVTLRNRVGLSPMCMFSARRGHVTEFHRGHYPRRAAGGCGLVIVEATAVEARGVIAPDDLGIWSDDQVAGLADVARLIASFGATPAIQLAHAGRKAGSYVTDDGGAATDVVGPSAIAFDATTAGKRPVPRELDVAGLATVRDAFVAAARRAVAAGFKVVELHLAHGYLLSSFLSPIPNRRADPYGGGLTNRMRFPLEVIDAVRAVLPDATPLLVRVSAVDPEPGGQTIDDTVAFARVAAAHGVDLVDCSAGGQTPAGWLRARPGYQVKFAETVRRGAGVPTAAVGMITGAKQAEAIVAQGRADLVLVGRAMLHNPDWARDAGRELCPDAPREPRAS